MRSSGDDMTERLRFRLLAAAEIVLGLGLLSGIAIEFATGKAFRPSTTRRSCPWVLAVIGVLLIAHARAGAGTNRGAGPGGLSCSHLPIRA